MTWADAAEYAFRKGEAWLRDHLAGLPDFPRPDPDHNLFYKPAVDAWLARRYCGPNETQRDWETELLGRTKNGNNSRALPRS